MVYHPPSNRSSRLLLAWQENDIYPGLRMIGEKVKQDSLAPKRVHRGSISGIIFTQFEGCKPAVMHRKQVSHVRRQYGYY